MVLCRRAGSVFVRNRRSLFGQCVPLLRRMQLLGGGGGEPAWGYCGSSIHASRPLGSNALEQLYATDVAKLNASVCLQRLVMHLRCCGMLRHARSAARARRCCAMRLPAPLQRLITKHCGCKPIASLHPRSKRFVGQLRPCRKRSELQNKLWTCVAASNPALPPLRAELFVASFRPVVGMKGPALHLRRRDVDVLPLVSTMPLSLTRLAPTRASFGFGVCAVSDVRWQLRGASLSGVPRPSRLPLCGQC